MPDTVIPEHGNREDFKRVLFELTIDSDVRDNVLSEVLKRHGLEAQALGRCDTEDTHNYVTTFAFSLPRCSLKTDLRDLFNQVAWESHMWFSRYQLNPGTMPSSAHYHGIVAFTVTKPLGEKHKDWYDLPPTALPLDRYVLGVADRLKRESVR